MNAIASHVCGYISMICIAFLLSPQFILNVRLHSTKGLSLVMIIIWNLASLIAGVYMSFTDASIPIILSWFAFTIFGMLIICQMYVYHPKYDPIYQSWKQQKLHVDMIRQAHSRIELESIRQQSQSQKNIEENEQQLEEDQEEQEQQQQQTRQEQQYDHREHSTHEDKEQTLEHEKHEQQYQHEHEHEQQHIDESRPPSSSVDVTRISISPDSSHPSTLTSTSPLTYPRLLFHGFILFLLQTLGSIIFSFALAMLFKVTSSTTWFAPVVGGVFPTLGLAVGFIPQYRLIWKTKSTEGMSFALICIDFVGVGTGIASLLLDSDDIDVAALAPYMTIAACQIIVVIFMCIYPTPDRFAFLSRTSANPL